MIKHYKILLFLLSTSLVSILLSCEEDKIDNEIHKFISYEFINKSVYPLDVNFELITYYKYDNVTSVKRFGMKDIDSSVYVTLNDTIGDKVNYSSLGSITRMRMIINFDLNDSISYSAEWESLKDTIKDIENSLHIFEWPKDTIKSLKLQGGYYKPRKQP